MQPDLSLQMRKLDGVFQGWGRGKYPTIESFEYSELTRFEYDERYPMIHLEQRTILADGEPGHWESGFLRWWIEGDEDSPGPGLVEMSIAQGGGRVEVLRGPLLELADGFRLELESVVLGHDERLVLTNRIIELRGDQLEYEMGMSTTTTDEPRFQVHVSAELQRQVEGEGQ